MKARCAPVPFCLSSLYPSGVPSLGREPKGRSLSVTQCCAFIADAEGYGIPSLDCSDKKLSEGIREGCKESSSR